MAQRAQPDPDNNTPPADPLPKVVREPFRRLSAQVTRLHWRWQLFHQLYVTGPRRIALLNEMAGGFFHETQLVMRDDLILAMARLLDRSRGALSLHRLLKLVKQTRAHGLVPELMVELARIEELAAPLIALRDTQIAHLEYGALPESVRPALPGIRPDLIDGVLASIANLMNTIQVELAGSRTAYAAVSSLSDADTLIAKLRRAADWKDLAGDFLAQKERLKIDRYHDLEKSRDWYPLFHWTITGRRDANG